MSSPVHVLDDHIDSEIKDEVSSIHDNTDCKDVDKGVATSPPSIFIPDSIGVIDHGPDCQHVFIQHDDHTGYIDDGHLICSVSKPTLVLHKIKCKESYPCSHIDTLCNHNAECVHPMIHHGDHQCYLVGRELHYPHDDHFDSHGSLDIHKTENEFPKTPRVMRRFRHWNSVRAEPVPWYKDHDSLRFFGMFFLTGGYFLVELIWGLMVDSLALVADSFHMLSDLIALCVGFYSLQVAKREKTHIATYGWTRMEVIGGLVNGILLLGMCFSILIEAIQRFFDPASDALADGLDQLIIVASVGLGINVLGLFLFGHGHDHHGHSHGHNHQHNDIELDVLSDIPEHDEHEHEHEHEHDGHDEHEHGHDEHGHEHEHEHEHENEHGCRCFPKIVNMNMRGVFLHVLGDALGSIAVLVSGIAMKYTSSDERFYADPICSLIIVCIIVYTTIPMVRTTVRVLLQQVPGHIDLLEMQKTLEAIIGIKEIHDLHVWSLTSSKFVGSMHVVLLKGVDFMALSDKMKLVCHEFGIHSTTIQPEFVTSMESGLDDFCHEPICSSADCQNLSCCPDSTKSSRKIL